MSELRFVGPLDRLLFLKSLPSVRRIPTPELTVFAQLAIERQFAAGDVVHARDEAHESFHIIVSGHANVILDGGATLPCGPTDDIGFLHMLAQRTDFEAIAETDMVTLEITRPDLNDMFEERFSTVQLTIQDLARYRRWLLDRLIGGSVRAPWPEIPAIPDDRDLDVIERIAILRQGALFEAVGLEAIVLMATSMRQERWTAGTRFWEVGAPARHMNLILSGTARCEMPDGRGSFVAGPGYPLGNIEALAREPRWYVPIAETDMVTLRADHETFFDIMEDDFEVAEIFLKVMSEGILDSMPQLADARGIVQQPGPEFWRR